MLKHEELNTNDKRNLAFAFYELTYGDRKLWDELPNYVKESEMGLKCKKLLTERNPDLIEEIGNRLVGEHWEIALGRS